MAYATPMVEATSLLAVTQLAANPPPNPHSPIQAGTQPLTLYIARVPGSRDVFLTPIKPREKVVTAEDVQSSLYYVHVSSDQDYAHLLKPTPPRPSSVNTSSSNLPTLAEKPKKVPPPLPRRPAPPSSPPYPTNSLPYPMDDRRPTGAGVRPPSPPTLPYRVTRKPISESTNSSWHAVPSTLPKLPSRPLPTPPDEPPSEEEPSLHADNLRLLWRSSHLNEHANPYSRDYGTHPETLKQLELDSRPEPGSLTLIRRDPGSMEQWNVASIYDPPVLEVSSSSLLVPTAKRRTKKGGAPLYMDITNPGYNQFTAPAPVDLDAFQSRTSISSVDSSNTPAPDGVFRRRLYMPGSRYGPHTYGAPASYHRKYSSLSAASGENSIRQTMREERHSVDMGVASSDNRSKGYSFDSPWDGSCEFTTGAAGRSLKCRHRIGNTVAEVSELRFNLPSSASPRKGRLDAKASSYFHRHRHQFSSTGDGEDDMDDGDSLAPTIMVTDDGRIDLSLGQEKAGGGFGGKQAKLGKLIINPEGVKMLDLLIAANVGLWWRAWERV